MAKDNDSLVSVVIVTKNRQQDLKQCLGSLCAQSVKIDELVLIDNGLSDYTQEMMHALKNNAAFPVKYCREGRVGLPIIYNRGIDEATYDWVAFIDDDCVADNDWYKEIKKSVSRDQTLAAVMGFSDTYYQRNLCSVSTALFNQEWKRRGIRGNRIICGEILDNRNIVYNRRFLRKHQIRFDESRSDFLFGAAEDVDLGIQIFKAKGRASYSPLMLVYHKDETELFRYLKKIHFTVKSTLSLSRKWDLGQITASKQPRYRYHSLIAQARAQYNLSSFFTLKLAMLVGLHRIYGKLLTLYYHGK